MATTATITPTLGSAPVTLQSGNYSAIDDRRFWSAGMREGVINGGSYQVIQRAAGANMTVDVASSVGLGAIVQGDSITGQGEYFVPQTAANVNVDIAAADATNPRNDLVVLEVKDDQHDASGLNLARVRVITGTPNASAALTDAPGANGTPALPSSCLLLAVVRVAAGATSIATAAISDRRPWAGGVPTYETSLPSPAADGQEIYFQSTTAGTGGGASNSMSTVGVTWHLRFRNAVNGGSTTYPWELISGAAITDRVETAETTTTGTGFVNIATNGPIMTTPLKGEYTYVASASAFLSADQTGIGFGISVNDATPANVDIITVATSGSGIATCVARNGYVTVTTAGHTIRMKYSQNSSLAVTYRYRAMSIVPIRVG